MPGAEINGASATNGAAVANSSVPKFNPERLGKMKSFLRAYVDRGDLPGMLALVNCDGKDVFKESIGMFDKESGTPMRFVD
jgi:hypothetical protein